MYRLTGIEVHRLFCVRRGIGLSIVSVTFAIIIGAEHCKQNDGDNLQSQGQDGELEPHVGGVRRHPDTECWLVISHTE